MLGSRPTAGLGGSRGSYVVGRKSLIRKFDLSPAVLLFYSAVLCGARAGCGGLGGRGARSWTEEAGRLRRISKLGPGGGDFKDVVSRRGAPSTNFSQLRPRQNPDVQVRSSQKREWVSGDDRARSCAFQWIESSSDQQTICYAGVGTCGGF